MTELISYLGEWVVSYLAIASVLAAVIIPLTYVATRVGPFRSAVHRHLLWSCCLLAIVLLPPIRVEGWGPVLKVLPARASAPQQLPALLPTPAAPKPGSAIPPVPDMSAEHMPAVPHTPIDETGHATTPVSAAATRDAAGPSLTWQAMLAMAWLAGVILLMARLAFAWLRLATLRALAKPVPSGLLDRLNIPTTSQAAVLVSQELAAPVCIGIARPSILLPQAMVQQGDADELAMVLAHEFAHVQRRDCLVNLLQRAFEAVFFFHPLAWMASRQLTQAREQVCDNHVLTKGASAMNYAELLCRTVERTPRTAISAVALFEGGLVQRLRNLKAATRSPLTGLGLFRRIGYATCVLAVFACLAVARLEATAATPQSQPSTGKSATSEPAEFTVTTTVDKDGRYVDKIDFPFRDDPAVIGLWTMVDTVKDVSSFKPGQKQWKGELFCKALAFWPNGRMQVGGTWTKGLIISPGDKTASKYTIKAIDGADYMFMEFKGGDYILHHQKPLYFVLKKENSDPKATVARIVDKVDYPFKDDPAVIGVWKSVDFVHEMADFKPGQKQWKDDLYLKQMVFLPNGRMSPRWASWTNGLVLHSGDKTASKYVIKTIDGAQYMFFEWKSGDYTIGGKLDVPYYILKKESSDVGEMGKAWANLPSDDQWRREFPAKLAKLDINTADLEQVKKVFGQPAQYAQKKTYPGGTAAKDLPKWFDMEYPDGFSIFMVDGGKKIYELRYSRPGYFFEGKLQVGSSLADVLKVVGQPKETVDGAPLEFKDGVLYTNIKDKRYPGWSNVGYYGRSDKCVRFFFADDKVSALYITSKTAQPWAKPPSTQPSGK